MIPLIEPDLSGNELKYITDCIKSKWISSRGSYVKEFENKFSEYCNTSYGISTSNGTKALHLALTALGIGKDDEVIVPDLTFAATANAVLYCGAKPILVDVNRDTWCIDVSKIEDAITKKTKAIIPVHLYGHPCDMGKIMEIARKHNLFVVEDAAEAHGAEYKGRKVGSIGDIGCFSFYGNKIITTGEGGMCVTNDEKLSEKMDLLKNHGMRKERIYWHDIVGYNYRMTNMQAAIGLAQLERIEFFVDRKREIARLYNSKLRDANHLILPKEQTWAKNVYWLYSVLINDKFKLTRDELIERLKNNGIDTRPLFYPLHSMPPYKSEGNFSVSDFLSKNGISLPSFINISEDQMNKILSVLLDLN